MSMIPLCVDLDKTLISQDVFRKSLLLWIKSLSISKAYKIPLNRHSFKEFIYEQVDLSSIQWTLNQEVHNLIIKEAKKKKSIFLVTGNTEKAGYFFASKLKVFESVMTSNNQITLKGRKKADTLAFLFGEKGFDYIGDSIRDIPIWRRCNHAYIVRNSILIKFYAALHLRGNEKITFLKKSKSKDTFLERLVNPT